jgi:hypothetical protein
MVALASGPSDRRQSLPLETTDRQTPDLPVSATVVLTRRPALPSRFPLRFPEFRPKPKRLSAASRPSSA